MMNCKRIIVVIFLFASCRLSAQITINDYRNEVVAYSHQLEISGLETERAEADMERAKRGYLPTVILASERSLQLQRQGRGKLLSGATRLGVEQTVYRGGAVHSAAKRAELMHERSGVDDELAMMDVCYSADVAYWGLSRAEALLAINRAYLSAVDSLRSIVERRFREGYSAKGDLLQVESRMSDARYQLSQREQSYLIALHGFNSLRGVSLDEGVALGDNIFDALPMPERADVALLLEYHPLSRRSALQSEYARWGVASARAPFLPSVDVNLYGALMPKYASPNGRLVSGVLGLSISTPIFHFGERSVAMRSAKIAYCEEQLRGEEVADNLRRDEADAWTNLVNSYHRVTSARSSLAIARENFDMSLYSYGEGMATILDVLQAQITWLQICENVVAAYYDYAMAHAAYDYVTARQNN